MVDGVTTAGRDSRSPRTVRHLGRQGNTLVADHWGDERGTPVLLMHGGGQTRFAWGGTAEALARQGYFVVALDLRGHGESDWAPGGDYRHDAFRDDVVAVVEDIGRAPAIVGASLGGIAGLIATGESGDGFARALVLVDIAPRMEPEGISRIGTFMNAHPDGFASLDEAADAVAAYQPHRPRPSDPSGLAKNLRLGEDGRWRWHWDPRFLSSPKRPSHDDLDGRMRRAASAVRVPVLLVRGQRSDILSEEGVAEFRQIVPHADYVDVRDVGHMVAGDRNDVFTEAVASFLARKLPPADGS